MSTSEADIIRRVLVRAAGAIIAGLVIQSLSIIWWAGGIEARMCHAEKDLDVLTTRVHAVEVDK